MAPTKKRGSNMNMKSSRASRRIGVLLNYMSLALFLGFYYTGYRIGWSGVTATLSWAFLAVALASFFVVHVKSGLWRFSHLPADKLDERQIMVTHDALRLSYAVFAVTCLLVMFFNALTGYRGHYLFNVVLPFCFLYFAHTLPASVIAWKETEV